METSPRFRIAGVVLLTAALGAPLLAETNLAGDWAAVPGERDLNAEIADYIALPLNDAARTFAETWDASRVSLLEHQCMPHVVAYVSRAPFPLRISMIHDPGTQSLIAIKIYFKFMEEVQTIWMDGRPQPSEFARHTWTGFSTGKWVKDTLVVTTTHMKRGWIRRNGVPESDLANLTEHWVRHGNYLTHTTFLDDPVYLTQPFFRTDTYVLDPNIQGNWLYPCEESLEEIPGYKRGTVPNYLIGQNPFLKEFANQKHLPYETTLGGSETMYPDYLLKLKKMQPNSSGTEKPAR
jgi:hypothetical protein